MCGKSASSVANPQKGSSLPREANEAEARDWCAAGCNAIPRNLGPEDEARTPRRLEAGRQGLVTILRAIRSGEATTRQEIERFTGMGRAVVVDRLNALEELGLIDEGALGKSTGGRAPRLVRPA